MLQRSKLLREALGYTQSEFTEYLGIVQTAYSMIENGIRPLSDRYIRVICIIFNVSEHYLLTGEGEMFQFFPYEKELLTLYGKLVPETQEYFPVVAREPLKIQQKLLYEGESRHLHDERWLFRHVHMG